MHAEKAYDAAPSSSDTANVSPDDTRLKFMLHELMPAHLTKVHGAEEVV